ncbi:hypothetical protein CDEST_11494 [Colletotrichum destructivum]|uniref:Zn(2)-C6 fungal-type domain-containing protein n=1 Tax=Colletotrichum destructivum TaxID=34406 RepID=A0AAX4ITE8_9PEZI|nr:hypothetical protein CDEST_11494 [Colletotrichum destructivum]
MYGQQRKYMSKRQRPCDFCRSRKAACRIDQAPPCRLCLLHGRECTFVEAAAPRKRPLPSEGIRDLDPSQSPVKAPISMITTASQAQVPLVLTDEHPPDDAAMAFVDGINFETTQSEFEAMFRSPRPPSSTPATAWTSNTPRQLRSRDEDNYPAGANPQLLGLSGDMDPLLLRHYRFDEGGMFGFKELAVHSVQGSPLPCHFLVSQQSIFSRRRDECGLERPDDETLSRQLQDIVPAAVGRRLVSLCMDFVQPLFPIFSTAEPPDPATAPTYLLAAIYAISLPFAVHDDKLSVDVAYDKPPYPALSRIVDSALSYELHSPSVPVVQTLLLLILRPSADPLVADTAYRRDALGRLVSCATTLGFHLDPSEWPMTDGRKAHRRRLSFTVYAVDQWIASSHGTLPFTHRDNWLVTNVRPVDFVDSGLGSHEESRLIDFATITEILGSALASLYSLRAVHELSKSRDAIPAVSQPLLHTLISMPNLNQTESSMRRLTILYTQLVIRRAELRPSLAQHPPHSPREDESELSARRNIKTCTRALTDVIQDLNPDTDGVFWPSWTQLVFSSVCFTLMTMAVSSPDAEEASDWIADLQSTRRGLRLKVASFPFLRLGLLRIDALFWRGITNVLDLRPHVEEAFRAADLI